MNCFLLNFFLAQCQDSLVAQDVPVLAAAVEEGTLHSGPSFRGTHAVSQSE